MQDKVNTATEQEPPRVIFTFQGDSVEDALAQMQRVLSAFDSAEGRPLATPSETLGRRSA